MGYLVHTDLHTTKANASLSEIAAAGIQGQLAPGEIGVWCGPDNPTNHLEVVNGIKRCIKLITENDEQASTPPQPSGARMLPGAATSSAVFEEDTTISDLEVGVVYESTVDFHTPGSTVIFENTAIQLLEKLMEDVLKGL